MVVTVTWNRTALTQFRALSYTQQQSAHNTIQAIKLSPRAAHYYHTVITHSGAARAVWMAYGLLVKVQFTLSNNGRQLLINITGVAPTDLPGIADYEDRS